MMKPSGVSVLCLFALASAARVQAQAPVPAPPSSGEGPYFHQVMSATSADGLEWKHDGRILLEHASVPAAIAFPDGRIRLYYVDASRIPENTNCAESRDGGESFAVLGCTIEGRAGMKAVDPSIVALPDGRFRLYYYASAQNPDAPGTHAIHAAISADGVHFSEEGRAFAYPGLVDPDVFWSGREWLMFVMALNQGTVVARSDDGLSFTYAGPHALDGWGTTAPMRLPDGRFRLYAFDQRGGQRRVCSFVSEDGLAWTAERGTRIEAPEGKEITDPFVVQLPDGSFKMFFKVSAARR
jgi:hypothetical protein